MASPVKFQPAQTHHHLDRHTLEVGRPQTPVAGHKLQVHPCTDKDRAHEMMNHILARTDLQIFASR